VAATQVLLLYLVHPGQPHWRHCLGPLAKTTSWTLRPVLWPVRSQLSFAVSRERRREELPEMYMP